MFEDLRSRWRKLAGARLWRYSIPFPIWRHHWILCCRWRRSLCCFSHWLSAPPEQNSSAMPWSLAPSTIRPSILKNGRNKKWRRRRIPENVGMIKHREDKRLGSQTVRIFRLRLMRDFYSSFIWLPSSGINCCSVYFAKASSTDALLEMNFFWISISEDHLTLDELFDCKSGPSDLRIVLRFASRLQLGPLSRKAR